MTLGIKKHKLLILSLIVFLVIAGGLVTLYQALNNPVSVNLKPSTKNVTNPGTYNINLTAVPVSDSLISFDYPKGLSLKSRYIVSKPSVDDYLFVAKDVYSWTLLIDISELPNGQLSELSSYQLRVDKSTEFAQTNQTVNNQSVVIFDDKGFTNGFSEVAYLTKDTYIATISLTGDDSSGIEPLVQTFNMVIDSWHWQ